MRHDGFNDAVAEVELFVFLLFAVAVLAGLGLRSRRAVPGRARARRAGHRPRPGPAVARARPRHRLLRLPAAAAVRGGDRRLAPHELRGNWAPIALLAVGLVLVTIAAVAAVANAVLGIPWAAAFVLGAVLGPTDPVSAAAVLDRLGVTGPHEDDPRRASRWSTTRTGADRLPDRARRGRRDRRLGGRRSALRVRRRRGGRDRDRARRRLGVRAPAADRHRPVAGRHAVGAHAVRRLRPGRGGARRPACSRPSPPASTSARARSTSSSPARACARSRSGSRPAFLLDGLLFVLIGVQVPTILDRIEDADAADAGRLRAADHRAS